MSGHAAAPVVIEVTARDVVHIVEYEAVPSGEIQRLEKTHVH